MNLMMNADGKTGILSIQGYDIPITLVEADVEYIPRMVDISTFGGSEMLMHASPVDARVILQCRSTGDMRKITKNNKSKTVEDPFPKRIVEAL